MSDPFREQRPLLGEEVSDEERAHIYSPPYSRRVRPADYRGRTRNKIKGAAAVMSRWPGFWSTSVAQLYVILGLLVLTTMVVYNTVAAFTMLPLSHANRRATVHSSVSNISKAARMPAVNMHVFVEDNKDTDFIKYLPKIELIANRFNDFNWNLFVVLNDTNNAEADNKSAEQHNDAALNSLFNKDKKNLVSKTGTVNIKHVSITKLMNDSPMKKQWRGIHSIFIPFLLRAVSVWEYGGIAFDPVIITQNSPNLIYMRKIENLLTSYKRSTIDLKPIFVPKKHLGLVKHHLKNNFDNIQDIIKAMEKEEKHQSYSQENLTEAESQYFKTVKNVVAKVPPETSNGVTDVRPHLNTGYKLLNFNNLDSRVESDFPNKVSTTEQTVNRLYPSLIPDASNERKSPLSFLKYFSYYKSKMNSEEKSESILTTKNYVTTERKDDLSPPYKKKNTYNPMIISAKEINPQGIIPTDVATTQSFDTNVLTIDLKGNIIATGTNCHAFIGTVFSNVHSTEAETITNFLIEELSIFCKGVLSLCKGINLILV